MNFVFTRRLRLTYAGQRYATFALNSLNLPRAPVSFLGDEVFGRAEQVFVLSAQLKT